MKSLTYQRRSALQCTWGLLLLLLALFALAGCNNQDVSTIPTPDLEILAPTATGVTARVEVVIVVVTATAAPAPSPTIAPTPPPPAEAAEEPAAQPTPAPTQAPADQAQAPAGQAQAQEMSNQELINMGEEIYATECASCHQLSGEGTDIYPALNQSGVLESGDPTQAIQIVLYGRGEMPAFEDTLSNQQIAAVISYERNAWQNDASVVRVAQVRQVREGGSATDDSAQTEESEAADTEAAASPTTDGDTTDGADETTTTPEATTAETTATPAETPTAEAAAAEDAQAAQSEQDLSEQDLIEQGETIYATECASCHQLNGEGNATYPALNENELLTADDPTAAIDIVLYGQGEMPAFVDLLSSEEIAAVLSHERNAWDNNASVVTTEQVEAVQQGEQVPAADATDEPTAELTATETMTPTGTVTATATTAMTSTATVTDTSTVESTPTPEAEATTGGDAGGTDVPLTWTPPVEVTPLLPTAEITGTAAMTTTPTVMATTSGDAGGPDVPLTWTPAREVTPLLPTAEIAPADGTITPTADGAAPGTPTPAATAVPAQTATVTGTVTSTGTVTTPTAAVTETTTAATATPTGAANGGAAANAEELISMGETIYAEECASCHRIGGEGTSEYPALNGSAMLTAEDPTAAITIVLNGQGEMPAFADILSTEEIAAVLSHERNAWDNNASVVTVEQVEEVSGN